jgi:hypothetical protein
MNNTHGYDYEQFVEPEFATATDEYAVEDAALDEVSAIDPDSDSSASSFAAALDGPNQFALSYRTSAAPATYVHPVNDGVTCERTPTQYRAIQRRWLSEASENQATGRATRRNGRPRHHASATQWRPLLTYFEARLSAREPLQTNYLADIDIDELTADRCSPLAYDTRHEIRPTVEEIVNAVKGVRFRETGPARPVDGDIEYAEPRVPCPPLNGPVRRVARLGGLRFATETGNGDFPLHSLTHWSAGRYWRRPVLHSARLRGAKDTRADLVATILGAEPGRRVQRRPTRRTAQCNSGLKPELPPTSVSFEEARRVTGLAPKRKEPGPALPYDVRAAREIFMSLQVRGSGRPSLRSEAPFAEQRLIHEEFQQLVRCLLSAEEVALLDTAIFAANFKDIGFAMKERQSEKSAERLGKSLIDELAKKLADLI